MCSNSVSCPLCCQTSFSSIDSLRISLIKAANGPLSCPICKEVLQGLDKLTIHLFSHTTVETTKDVVLENHTEAISFNKKDDMRPSLQVKTFALEPNIDELIPSKNKKIDIVKDVEQPVCDICELSFRSEELLQMHNNLIHRSAEAQTTSGEAMYQCHLCTKVFKMKGSLRVHLKVVHLLGLSHNRDETTRLNICEKIRRKNLINTSTAVNENGHYNPSLPSCANISSNIKAEFSNTESAIGKKAAVENSRSGESTKIWDCDICSKSFTTKYFLKKHKRLHTGEMPYTCEICGKTFTFQQSYHKHLLYHSDEKPHVCQTCGRAFKELSTLHNHERIHSGEKPFKCETCGKCFRQRVSYLVHKRIHTGAMPYKCSECNKSFRYKVSQKTHKCVAQQQKTVQQHSPQNRSPSQTNDILEKLLHSSSILPDIDRTGNGDPLIVHPPIANVTEDILSKTIDDIVKESCDKMGICDTHNMDIPECLKISVNSERIPSPSDKFQNLCLYSPTNNASFIAHLDCINDDSFKQLFYEDDAE